MRTTAPILALVALNLLIAAPTAEAIDLEGEVHSVEILPESDNFIAILQFRTLLNDFGYYKIYTYFTIVIPRIEKSTGTGDNFKACTPAHAQRILTAFQLGATRVRFRNLGWVFIIGVVTENTSIEVVR